VKAEAIKRREAFEMSISDHADAKCYEIVLRPGLFNALY